MTNSNIGIAVDEGADRAVAALQAQVARVEALRRDRDVGLRREALLLAEGAQRGLLAGGVAVEREDDLAGRRSRRPSRVAAP